MLRNSGSKPRYGYKEYTGNSSKRFNADDEDFTKGSSHKRARLETSNPTLNTKPSRSIPPPNRPGSLQTAYVTSGEADIEVDSKAEGILRANARIEYTYSPLQPGQFRLLRLHPARGDDDQVSCSLVTDSVHAPSAYEALSYVWGDCAFTGLISLSDEDESGTFTISKQCQVGLNLYHAIHALRLPDRPVVLWVDALCIDQSNNQEKCAQVAMMITIFKNAHRVLAWLGLSDPHSDRVFSIMAELLRPGFFSTHGQESRTDDSQGLTVPAIWNSFLHLCSRPYWSRMWVIQELAMAADVTFVCN